jgi:hypothetical protein
LTEVQFYALSPNLSSIFLDFFLDTVRESQAVRGEVVNLTLTHSVEAVAVAFTVSDKIPIPEDYDLERGSSGSLERSRVDTIRRSEDLVQRFKQRSFVFHVCIIPSIGSGAR